jgi:hypothetical protein
MHWVEPARDDRERAVERRRETAPPRTPQILALQRTAGNRAVAAMLSRSLAVTGINYDQGKGTHTPEEIPVETFRDALRNSAFLGKLNGQEKERLKIGTANLQAADLPALAQVVVDHVAGQLPARRLALAAYAGEVEAALVKATPVKVHDQDDVDVFNRIKLQATMSRSKGTPNTITLANLGKVLDRAAAGTTSLNARVKANNANSADVSQYMAQPDLAPSLVVSYDLPVRSPHTNGAGWLPASSAPTRLDVAAATWAATAATAPTNVGRSLSAAFGTPPNGVTARAVEETAQLVPEARKQYYARVWSQLNARRRAEHAWTQYTSSWGAVQGAFIEFTAEKGLGVNRFVWDLINDRYYVSLHYNWIEGYNPFFEVTGLPSSY